MQLDEEGGYSPGLVFGLLGGLAVLVALAWAFFFFPGGGTVSRHVTGGGFSSGSSGMEVGWDVCNVGPGQSLRVDVDIRERRSGALNVCIWNAAFFSFPKIIETHRLVREGRDEWRFRPPHPGRYRVTFSPVPDGHGYDFKYEASWKVE
ncbi:MAG: hypothetical protein SFU85_10460 [Candidatus Methylacidiphilales bacterium]|nr:hypothetical protein [Candidatus Methylacidiphilales bacterium]